MFAMEKINILMIVLLVFFFPACKPSVADLAPTTKPVNLCNIYAQEFIKI